MVALGPRVKKTDTTDKSSLDAYMRSNPQELTNHKTLLVDPCTSSLLKHVNAPIINLAIANAEIASESKGAARKMLRYKHIPYNFYAVDAIV
jgi:hypothetical protein